MDPARFTRVDATTWRIEPHGAMRVPAIIYADEDLIRNMDDKVYEQAIVTIDTEKRKQLLQQSTQIALDTLPLIPLPKVPVR